MSSHFVPDRRFRTFSDLTPEYLHSIGVRALILDVDNTLEPYENPLPGEPVRRWIASLKEAGIVCGIVSNNGKGRIGVFGRELSLPTICHAAKPFSRSVRKMIAVLGAKREETALLGDQIFTDVWAAKNAGIRAFLVPPIRDRGDPLTKCKRFLEKPFLRKYQKLHPDEQNREENL